MYQLTEIYLFNNHIIKVHIDSYEIHLLTAMPVFTYMPQTNYVSFVSDLLLPFRHSKCYNILLTLALKSHVQRQVQTHVKILA